MTYNAGSEEDKRNALGLVSEYTKLLITLATGAVALSATFLDRFYRGHSLSLLVWAWSVLGASVVLGLLALGAHISQLAESKLKPRRSLLEVLNLLQYVAFITGGVLFGLVVISNVTAKPLLTILSRHALVDVQGVARLPMLCRTNDASGCALAVSLMYSDSHTAGHPEHLRKHTRIASDVDGVVRLVLPRRLSRTVRHTSVAARVRVDATSRFGAQSQVTALVALKAVSGRRRHRVRPNPKRRRTSLPRP